MRYHSNVASNKLILNTFRSIYVTVVRLRLRNGYSKLLLQYCQAAQKCY